MSGMESSVLKAVGFVHLHVHSAYSLREGALTIETLAKLAKADDMPALGIADTNNLFGALEFSEKLAGYGVQPIIGAQTMIDFADAPTLSSRFGEQRLARAPIVLIAQNEAGYRNLMRLVTRLWLDPKDGDEPHIPFGVLGTGEGLIALTGGPGGPVDSALKAGMTDLAESRLKRLIEVFDSRLYVELQRHDLDAERAIEPRLIDLADRFGRRWSRPTSPISPRVPTTKRMTPCSASPKARSSRRPSAAACRRNTASRPAPK